MSEEHPKKSLVRGVFTASDEEERERMLNDLPEERALFLRARSRAIHLAAIPFAVIITIASLGLATLLMVNLPEALTFLEGPLFIFGGYGLGLGLSHAIVNQSLRALDRQIAKEHRKLLSVGSPASPSGAPTSF